eukprot:1958147-Prorocentrum_lima.AAC.1
MVATRTAQLVVVGGSVRCVAAADGVFGVAVQAGCARSLRGGLCRARVWWGRGRAPAAGAESPTEKKSRVVGTEP